MCLHSSLFVDIDEEYLHSLECPVGGTGQILANPIRLACCGAVLCAEHCSASASSSSLKSAAPALLSDCPKCGAPIPSSLVSRKKDFVVEGLLGNLITKCRNSAKGCAWTGKLSTVDDHLQHKCDFVVLSCPFAAHGCTAASSTFSLRSELEAHLKSEADSHLLLAMSSLACQQDRVTEQHGQIQALKDAIQNEQISAARGRILQQHRLSKLQQRQLTWHKRRMQALRLNRRQRQQQRQGAVASSSFSASFSAAAAASSPIKKRSRHTVQTPASNNSNEGEEGEEVEQNVVMSEEDQEGEDGEHQQLSDDDFEEEVAMMEDELEREKERERESTETVNSMLRMVDDSLYPFFESKEGRIATWRWRIDSFSSKKRGDIISKDFQLFVPSSSASTGITPPPFHFRCSAPEESLLLYVRTTHELRRPFFAQMAFGIINQLNERRSLHRYTRHQFAEDSISWGYSNFMPLVQLCEEENGFLLNDSIIVEITMRLFYPEDENPVADGKKSVAHAADSAALWAATGLPIQYGNGINTSLSPLPCPAIMFPTSMQGKMSHLMMPFEFFSSSADVSDVASSSIEAESSDKEKMPLLLIPRAGSFEAPPGPSSAASSSAMQIEADHSTIPQSALPTSPSSSGTSSSLSSSSAAAAPATASASRPTRAFTWKRRPRERSIARSSNHHNNSNSGRQEASDSVSATASVAAVPAPAQATSHSHPQPSGGRSNRRVHPYDGSQDSVEPSNRNGSSDPGCSVM